VGAWGLVGLGWGWGVGGWFQLAWAADEQNSSMYIPPLNRATDPHPGKQNQSTQPHPPSSNSPSIPEEPSSKAAGLCSDSACFRSCLVMNPLASLWGYGGVALDW